MIEIAQQPVVTVIDVSAIVRQVQAQRFEESTVGYSRDGVPHPLAVRDEADTPAAAVGPA